MSLQLRVAIEVSDTTQEGDYTAPPVYVRLDHTETVMPAGEGDAIRDFLDLADATLGRMVTDIGARASSQLKQISERVA